MIKYFDRADGGGSLLESYARQVVRSQYKRRADVAEVDREVCSKNIIELKSYFVSSLTSKITPGIHAALHWVEEASVERERAGNRRSSDQGADEVLETLRATIALLSEIQEFSQLEAGVCSDMPETLDINDIVNMAHSEVCGFREAENTEFVLALPETQIFVLGYREKLVHCLTNVFRYCAHSVLRDCNIHISVRRISEFEVFVSAKFSGVELSPVEIERALSSLNLVENIIAIGADDIKLALPIAGALMELHSGHLTMKVGHSDMVEIGMALPLHK